MSNFVFGSVWVGFPQLFVNVKCPTRAALAGTMYLARHAPCVESGDEICQIINQDLTLVDLSRIRESTVSEIRGHRNAVEHELYKVGLDVSRLILFRILQSLFDHVFRFLGEPDGSIGDVSLDVHFQLAGVVEFLQARQCQAVGGRFLDAGDPGALQHLNGTQEAPLRVRPGGFRNGEERLLHAPLGHLPRELAVRPAEVPEHFLSVGLAGFGVVPRPLQCRRVHEHRVADPSAEGHGRVRKLGIQGRTIKVVNLEEIADQPVAVLVGALALTPGRLEPRSHVLIRHVVAGFDAGQVRKPGHQEMGMGVVDSGHDKPGSEVKRWEAVTTGQFQNFGVGPHGHKSAIWGDNESFSMRLRLCDGIDVARVVGNRCRRRRHIGRELGGWVLRLTSFPVVWQVVSYA